MAFAESSTSWQCSSICQSSCTHRCSASASEASATLAALRESFQELKRSRSRAGEDPKKIFATSVKLIETEELKPRTSSFHPCNKRYWLSGVKLAWLSSMIFAGGSPGNYNYPVSICLHPRSSFGLLM